MTDLHKHARALQQARAQHARVRKLMAAYHTAIDLGESTYLDERCAPDEMWQRVLDSALGVEACSPSWRSVAAGAIEPEEYRIVLCTGGPHATSPGAWACADTRVQRISCIPTGRRTASWTLAL